MLGNATFSSTTVFSGFAGFFVRASRCRWQRDSRHPTCTGAGAGIRLRKQPDKLKSPKLLDDLNEVASNWDRVSKSLSAAQAAITAFRNATRKFNGADAIADQKEWTIGVDAEFDVADADGNSGRNPDGTVKKRVVEVVIVFQSAGRRQWRRQRIDWRRQRHALETGGRDRAMRGDRRQRRHDSALGKTRSWRGPGCGRQGPGWQSQVGRCPRGVWQSPQTIGA